MQPQLLLFLHLSLVFISSSSSPSSSDITTLLTFKSLINSSLLSSWSPSTSPCSSWLFISCHPLTHQISHLHLSNLTTNTLPIPSSSLLLLLSNLSSLRLLSLPSLPLSGPLPTTLPSSSLRFLLLPHNLLSGPISPNLLISLPKLTHLDLSFNLLSGPIPPFYHPLKLLNLSSNSLSGPIPYNLSSFPSSSFLLNPHLCGPPLPNHCTTIFADPKPQLPPTAHPGGMSRVVVVAIVVGDFIALLFVSLLLFCYFWRKFAGRGVPEGEKIVYSSSPYVGIGNNYNVGGGGGGNFGERGKMVVFEGTRRFELEDLLRASAEMLGKGGMGTAYKAVLDDGSAVAVKRLREVVGGGVGRREFEAQMDAIGRMRHPNLVTLKGYYYARDEKLLVYEFMPGGSLFGLLHGKVVSIVSIIRIIWD